MENIDLIGIDTSFSPLSNSFSIDLINERFYFKKSILIINRITFSLHSEFLNTFTVINKNYNCISLTINIRFDYICNNNSINYELFTLNKLINICSNNVKYDKRCNVYASVMDSSILNINENEVDFYVLFGCCLC